MNKIRGGKQQERDGRKQEKAVIIQGVFTIADPPRSLIQSRGENGAGENSGELNWQKQKKKGGPRFQGGSY